MIRLLEAVPSCRTCRRPERAGVAEFWLLHPLERLLTIYRMHGSTYGAAEILEATGIQALTCVPLHVDFAQVFVGEMPEG